MFLSCIDINTPTNTKAPAVTLLDEKILNTGNSTIDIKNKNATTKFENPVLAPASTPVALSTYEVTTGVPNVDPTTVPIASDKNAFSTFGKFPSSSVSPAAFPTAISVPAVSNISTNSKANTINITWKIL